MSAKYTIGLDYGINSVRALVVDTANGHEMGMAVWNYEHGTDGVILSCDPNLARQHPADYVQGAEVALKKALAAAKRKVRGFKPEQIIDLAWTPRAARRFQWMNKADAGVSEKFSKNPAVMAWFWKEHTSITETTKTLNARQKVAAVFSWTDHVHIERPENHHGQ